MEALLDFNCNGNVISYESVKVDPKLKIYDLRDHERDVCVQHRMIIFK